MSESLIEQLKTLIVENLDVTMKADEIDSEISLLSTGLGLDSVEIIKLMTLSEKHFRIAFSDEDLTLDNFVNLRVLADFISKKINI